MNTRIEKEFFGAYNEGGIADLCLRILKSKYGVKTYSDKKNYDYFDIEKDKIIALEAEIKENINELLYEFDNCNLDPYEDNCTEDSPLIEEIRSNLNEIEGNDRERYLYTLLSPFAKYSEVMFPSITDRRIDQEIEISNAFFASVQKILIETHQDKYPDTYEDKIKKHQKEIEELEEFRDRAQQIDDLFVKIENMECPAWSPEYIYRYFNELMRQYSLRLDALLLTYGIDLFDLQEKCSISISDDRDYFDLERRFGTDEIVYRYIQLASDKQSLEPQTETQIAKTTPKELATVKATGVPQRGRPVKPLKDNLLCDDDKKNNAIKLLHDLIDGKKGKDVVLVIIAAQRANLISKITHKQAQVEFGDIGNEQGYNKYMRDSKTAFKEDEINPICERIKAVAGL